jgi:hypothetical protein
MPSLSAPVVPKISAGVSSFGDKFKPFSVLEQGTIVMFLGSVYRDVKTRRREIGFFFLVCVCYETRERSAFGMLPK